MKKNENNLPYVLAGIAFFLLIFKSNSNNLFIAIKMIIMENILFFLISILILVWWRTKNG